MNRHFQAFLMASLFLLSSCATVDRSIPVQVRGQIPQTPEYVIRNGEKVPFDQKKLEDGDIIELGEGVYDVNNTFDKAITIAGAGIDKTFLLTSGIDGWGIVTDKGAVVKNVSIVNPAVRIFPANPVRGAGRIVFLNVKTYGYIRVNNMSGQNGNRYSVTFLFSQLDHYLGEYNLTQARFWDDFVVLFSWRSDATHEPISDRFKLGQVTPGVLKDIWLKEAKFESPDSPHNIQLFNRLYNEFRANARIGVGNGPNDQLIGAFEVASNQISSLNNDGIQRVADTAEIEKSLRQAEKFKAGGNLLLASAALSNAKQANMNQPNERIDALIQANNKKISALYGCNISYRRADSNNNTSMADLEKDIEGIYRNKVGDISKLITKLGSPDSACSLEIVAKRDSYAGGDTGTKVVSTEQLWKEDPQVKAMREMYRNAANRAAEQAAQAQFTNSLDRLQSTAKQLSQNRNKIESRTDGLYLVTNNRSIKGNSAADTRGYQSRIDQANKAIADANSINGDMIKDGTKTTTEYYKTEVNYIEYRLEMKTADQQRIYDFPEELYQRSSGPCQRTSYSDSNVKTSSGGWNTSCNVTGYRANTRERYTYISQYLVTPTDQFLLETVYPHIIKEVQRKRSQKDPESQLDGIILAALFSNTTEPSEEYEQLMLKVFGYTIPLSEFQARVLAI